MAGLRRGMWIIRNMFNQAELDSYPVARELTGIYLTLRDPNVGGAVRRFDLPPLGYSSAYDYLTDAPQSKCGRGLAPDGGRADQDVGLDRVHIRFCGHGC
ncbi:MAG: hypothetical protein K0S85_1163 [Pseudomonas orientalis]|nr:hypothetical protein [Pseudomonas orientalis]